MSEPWLSGLSPAGRVHFVGIGGAGMSALAEAVSAAGYDVTGCDAAEGERLAHLRSLGIETAVGHAAEHAERADALVVTAALASDHPELAEARRREIPVVKRAAALGAWVRKGRIVAVAGTHGKTTTSAMAAELLAAAGERPTAFVGGTVARWKSNYLAGDDRLFVVEADEYDRSFLELEPDIAIVTNVEADHLDVYGDLAGVDTAFGQFLSRVRPGGTVLVCGDDHGSSRIAQSVSGPTVVAYGLNPGLALRAVDLKTDAGGTRFQVWDRGEPRGELFVPQPGVHNVRNALAAAGAARALGVSWDAIRQGITGYGGVGRRFETVGVVDAVHVVDDYAHHPTEVAATLRAARTAFPERRLVAVFQPHLFSRTRDFHEEFGVALAEADVAWVTGIYPARERPIEGVTGQLVAEAARKAGGQIRYREALDGLAAAVADGLEPGDLCLTMGAGSIERVGGEIIAALEAKRSGSRTGVVR